jgi:hypothetical protein
MRTKFALQSCVKARKMCYKSAINALICLREHPALKEYYYCAFCNYYHVTRMTKEQYEKVSQKKEIFATGVR